MESLLRVVTLNLGSNVMANVEAGSEKGFVKLCREVYGQQPARDPQTGLSPCTNNAALLVASYDLIFLQEANPAEWGLFEQALAKLGAAKGKVYASIYNTNGVATVFDRQVLGDAVPVSHPSFSFSDHRGTFKDYRGLQVIFFPMHQLLAVNLHAPHGIELVPSISTALLYVLNTWNAQHEPLVAKRVLLGGDFNDYRGKLLEPGSPKIKVAGLVLEICRPRDGSVLRSCCHDTQYRFPGDYLLDSNLAKLKYAGFPPGYDRKIHLVSDHDPVVYVTSL